MSATDTFPGLKRLATFITERHNIFLRKRAGQHKPWTSDDILMSYRFCNVYRELDTVTQWIAKHWREPHADDQDLWFAFVVARLVNWPDTLAELSPAVFNLKTGSVSWNAGKFVRAMHRRKAAGEKVFSGAYIVSTNGRTMDKAEYLAECVLTPIWEHRRSIRPRAGDTLADFHARLMGFIGMGSFMAGQVVADLKYRGVLANADDWHTWAAPGPGSKRGLNRVCGNDDVGASWRPEHWLQVLQELRVLVNKLLPNKWEQLHAQDLQNCLCEFDKYERTRLGEGRPRSTYPGGK